MKITLPFIPKSKKNCYAAFRNRIVLTSEAKREALIIGDACRAMIALDNGGIASYHMDDLIAAAMRFRDGGMPPKEWERQVEAVRNMAPPPDRSHSYDVSIRVFRERGQPSKGSVEITLTPVADISGDVRRMTDVDGVATSILDALKGVVYLDDKQVDRVEAIRFRIDP